MCSLYFSNLCIFLLFLRLSQFLWTCSRKKNLMIVYAMCSAWSDGVERTAHRGTQSISTTDVGSGHLLTTARTSTPIWYHRHRLRLAGDDHELVGGGHGINAAILAVLATAVHAVHRTSALCKWVWSCAVYTIHRTSALCKWVRSCAVRQRSTCHYQAWRYVPRMLCWWRRSFEQWC